MSCDVAFFGNSTYEAGGLLCLRLDQVEAVLSTLKSAARMSVGHQEAIHFLLLPCHIKPRLTV